MDIKTIPFFQGLSEGELAAVRSCLREKAFEKGESLFTEGDLCERVFFVKEGRVKIYRLSSSGREQTLETLGPGDTCACNPGSGGWRCSSSAEALTPAVVWFLSRDNYVKLVQTNAHLSHSLNRLFAERLQCFSALIEEVSLKDSKAKLVKFLLDELQKGGNGGAVELPFTRQEIAQRIGMARETVARQLHDLKHKKLIEIEPGKIVVRDRAALQKLLS